MKKIFSILWGIGILALSVFSVTSAYTQEQIESYNWAYEYGITSQPTIEAANLDGNITRQAFSKMIANYLENLAWTNLYVLCNFTDTDKIAPDLQLYTRVVCGHGIMWKNGSNFNPTQPVDRAQLWTVLSRILWWDENNSTWKQYYIYHLNALKQNGIMNKIDNPQTYAKRWEVMIMLKRLYEKYGSNIYMNGKQSSAYDTKTENNRTNNNPNINPTTDYTTKTNENNEWNTDITATSIIYKWKDGSEYTYNTDFINLLIKTADKKWESNLSDFLKIESDFFEGWLEIANFDEEKFSQELWIDLDNIDKDNMTKKEKENLADKFGIWVKKLVTENKDRNNKFIKDLGKVVNKLGKDDKFWLKEKYEKSKTYIEVSNWFLDTYAEMITNLMKVSMTAEEWDENEEAMGQAFALIWAALAYQANIETYQTYLNTWWINAIKLLGWELDTPAKEYEYTNLDITADVKIDWTVDVIENYTADFFVPKHWIIRNIPLNYAIWWGDLHINISDVDVKWQKFSSNISEWDVIIKIWDSNKTVTWKQNYPISYSTYGLILDAPWKDYALLYWNLVGDEFDTNINKVKATINLPKKYPWFTDEDFQITTNWKYKNIKDFEWTVDYSKWDKIIITYDKWLPSKQWITLVIKFPGDYFKFDEDKQAELYGYVK